MAAQIMTDLENSSKPPHRIIFHISQVVGLQTKSSWNMRPGTSVSLQVGSKEAHSTENRRLSPGTTSWSENLPSLEMSADENVQFQLNTNKMLARRKTLGTSGVYNVEQLLKMQNADPDGLLQLPILLETSPGSPPGSPRSPRSPRTSMASFRSSTTRPSGNFLEVPNVLPSTSPIGSIFGRNRSRSSSVSTSPPLSPGSSSPPAATLLVKVKEMPADSTYNIRLNADNLRAFVNQCRTEALQYLGACIERIVSIQIAFVENAASFSFVIDIVLGGLEATRKMLANPDIININRLISHTMKAFDEAFEHYQTLSQRQFEKRGESSISLLQEMLSSVLNTACIVDAILTENDAFSRDRLESKLITWADYFTQCRTYLQTPSDQRPVQPSHRSSSRVHYPRSLEANTQLPKHNMLTMTLPEPDVSPSYQSVHTNTTREIAAWIFTPPPNERHLTPKPSALSFATKRSGSTSPPPLSPTSPPLSPTSTVSSASHVSSPRQTNKPALLVLKPEDDNFQPENVVVKGILKSAASGEITPTPASRELGFGLGVFYVSVPLGRGNGGRKQLAAALCQALAQTKNLGGYFSFNQQDAAPCSTQTFLDALPITLVHQLANVETEMTDHFVASFKTPVVSQALQEKPKLISTFETIFSEPVKDFVTKNKDKKNLRWNPLEPLVFVIDAVGLGEVNGGQDEEKNAREAHLFMDWLSSRGMRGVPSHIKWLVLTSAGSNVERSFKERGAQGSQIGSKLGDSNEIRETSLSGDFP